jgi:hypothetical protein
MAHDITEDLEAMIDKHGLLHVITALELVCCEKAAHLRSNGQVQSTAWDWSKAGNFIYDLARKVDALGL